MIGFLEIAVRQWYPPDSPAKLFSDNWLLIAGLMAMALCFAIYFFLSSRKITGIAILLISIIIPAVIFGLLQIDYTKTMDEAQKICANENDPRMATREAYGAYCYQLREQQLAAQSLTP